MFSSKGVPPGPRLPANGNLGVMSPQLRPPAPSNQQKGPIKNQGMQRQLNHQQHTISNTVSWIQLRQISITVNHLGRAFIHITASLLTAVLLLLFRIKTMHMISSVVISQDRLLIISSHEVWWEFSRGISSQVLYISGKTELVYVKPYFQQRWGFF